MRKESSHRLASAVLAILLAGTAVAGIMEEDGVVDLVDKTTTDLETDVASTFDLINRGDHPYQNKYDKAHYVFVYDTEVTIVAHPKQILVGKCYKGKTDVRGKKFQDDIVAGALADSTGWITYSYTKPGDKGIHAKKTYFRLSKGSDGVTYVVCSGMYID
ncbi:MAG: hypothetical protein GY838_07810 [bacterium]|nr:hypothetical protein [bacterium]